MSSRVRYSPPLRLHPLAAAFAIALSTVWLASPMADATAAALAKHPHIVVANCDDDGPGSLREAYANAASGDVINLDALQCSVITLTTGALQDGPIDSVTLVGKPGLMIDAGGTDRAIVHNGTGTLTLENLQIGNGDYTGAGGGGCVKSQSNLAVYHSTISGCHVYMPPGAGAANGGAISSQGSVIVQASRIQAGDAEGAYTTSTGGCVYALGDVIVEDDPDEPGSGSTIEGCNASTIQKKTGGLGGGIYARGAVSVVRSTIAGNHAYDGGGIFSSANSPYSTSVVIIESTISSNHSEGTGSAINTLNSVSSYNSTITANHCDPVAACGAVNAGGNVLSISSIISGNVNDAGDNFDVTDKYVQAIEGRNNLIGRSSIDVPVDTIVAAPNLGPLQDNGGATHTHLPLPGSPALAAGTLIDSSGPVDQRGLPRASDGVVDVGAVQASSGGIFKDGFD